MKSGKPIKLKKEHSIKFTLQACESVIYKKLEKHAKKGETKELVAAFNDKYEEFNEKERSMNYLLENYKTMLEQFEDTMKHKDLEYFNIKKQVKDFALRMSNMADEKQVEEFKSKISELEQNNKNLQSELDTEKIENKKLKDEIEASKKNKIELDNYKSKINQIQKDNQDLRCSIRSSLKPSQSNQQNLVDKKMFEDIISNLENENKSFQEDLEKKEKELSELKNQLQAKKDEVFEKDYQIVELKKNITTNNETISKKENEISELKKENEGLKSEIKELKKIQENSVNMKLAVNKVQSELSPSDQVIVENIFLIFLLNRTPTYEKCIEEVYKNLDYYMNYLHKSKYNLNDLYSSILEDFIYQVHNKASKYKFFCKIFDHNYLNKTEIPYDKYTTLSYVKDQHLTALQKKIDDYKMKAAETYEKLKDKLEELYQKDKELKEYYTLEETSLYGVSVKGVIRVNLFLLNSKTVKYLCNFIKYMFNYKFTGIEFYGVVQYEQGLCDYFYKLIFELYNNQKDNITQLIVSQIKGFEIPFTNILNTILSVFPIKDLSIINSGLNENQIVLVNIAEYKSKLETLDLSGNNLPDLEMFDKGPVPTKVILRKNPLLKFRAKDKDISFMYLDISSNELTKEKILNFASCFKASNMQLLNISGNLIAEDTSLFLGECLFAMKNLKVLYLNNCKFPTNSLSFLSKTNYERRNLSLLEIYFNDNDFEHSNLESFINLFVGPSVGLLKLEMKGCQLTQDDLKIILAGIKNIVKFKELNLLNNGLSPECKLLLKDFSLENIKLLI